MFHMLYLHTEEEQGSHFEGSQRPDTLWTVVSVQSKHPRQLTSVVQETEAIGVYARGPPSPATQCFKLHLETYTLPPIPAAETETVRLTSTGESRTAKEDN